MTALDDRRDALNRDIADSLDALGQFVNRAAGQAYVQAFAQRIPFDQKRFVNGCVTAGSKIAELREAEARHE